MSGQSGRCGQGGPSGRIERPVILCGDEFCLNVARYRLVDVRDVSRPLYLCETCFEKLSDTEKRHYEKSGGHPPLILNTNEDRGGCGCSGCGPHPRRVTG